MTTLAGAPPAQQDTIARPAELATLRVTLRRSSRRAHMVVRGEVNSATISQFKQALHAAAGELPRFVVDLSGAHFLSLQGIRLLYLYRDHIIAALATADSVIAEVLTVAGYPIVTLAPTRPAAPATSADQPDQRHALDPITVGSPADRRFCAS